LTTDWLLQGVLSAHKAPRGRELNPVAASQAVVGAEEDKRCSSV